MNQNFGKAIEAVREWAANNRAQQPGIIAELKGLGRQGREDFINNALFPGQNLTREIGSPGNPTPQLVTQDLTDKEVDRQKDVVIEHTNERSR